MIKRFFERSDKEIGFGEFIGQAFVTCLITMALCLSVLIFFDILN